MRENSLGSQNTGTTNSPDSSLGGFAEEFGFNNNRLVGESALSENGVVSGLCDINDGGFFFIGLIFFSGFLRNKAPEFIEIDDRVVSGIFFHVIVSHSLLSEVSRMAIEKNCFSEDCPQNTITSYIDSSMCMQS